MGILRHGWAFLYANIGHGLMIFFAMLILVYPIERLTGQRTSQYRTRNCVTDCLYWLYDSSGLNDLAVRLLVFGTLSRRFEFLSLHLERYLHPVARYLLAWVVIDFAAYWLHRMFHKCKYLWPFHMTHHSQEVLTFATAARFHPVENMVAYSVMFILVSMIGPVPVAWVWLGFALRQFPSILHHTEINWRYGPFYRILVSPVFHSFHHSKDPRHYDRNYGIELSIWDFLFGTAVDEKVRVREYGVVGVQWTTIREQLLNPFALSRRLLFPKPTAAPPIQSLPAPEA